MTPFPAWLAMSIVDHDLPVQFEDSIYDGISFLVSDKASMVRRKEISIPRPVLIVADTPENRQKLGMEEG